MTMNFAISLLRISMAVLSVCQLSSGLPTPTPASPKTVVQGIDYLKQFGYLIPKDPKQGQIMSQGDLVQSIKSLQLFAGLPPTGVFDTATVQLMAKRRCGMPDKSPADKAKRKRRYTLHGTYWKKKYITYRIKGWTSDVSQADQRRIYKWAFEQWSKASKITVTEAPMTLSDDDVEILINWERNDHGDGYPFDGQGGVLAHAFYPHNNKGISGDAHFDDDERYTVGTEDGVNLDWVALHEFGHSLGIDHSTVHGSIMFPWYQGYRKDIKLTEDDIMAIQGIYGKRKGVLPDTRPPPTVNPSGPTPTKRPKLDECLVDKYDDWFYDDYEEKTYAFKDDYYFVINPYTVGVMEGPLKIADKWKHVRTPINAVYKRLDGRVIFFTGDKFWRYMYDRLESGPRSISEYGLDPKVLSNMDSIFIWGRNRKTYIVKGDQYWRYNEHAAVLDYGYPRSLKVWRGIPNNVDAVMKWKNGKTYFFKGKIYYKLDDYSITVEAGYPKKTAIKWMRCDSARLALPKPSIKSNETEVVESSGDVGADVSSGSAVLPSLIMLIFSALTAGRMI